MRESYLDACRKKKKITCDERLVIIMFFNYYYYFQLKLREAGKDWVREREWKENTTETEWRQRVLVTCLFDMNSYVRLFRSYIYSAEADTRSGFGGYYMHLNRATTAECPMHSTSRFTKCSDDDFFSCLFFSLFRSIFSYIAHFALSFVKCLLFHLVFFFCCCCFYFFFFLRILLFFIIANQTYGKTVGVKAWKPCTRQHNSSKSYVRLAFYYTSKPNNPLHTHSSCACCMLCPFLSFSLSRSSHWPNRRLQFG